MKTSRPPSYLTIFILGVLASCGPEAVPDSLQAASTVTPELVNFSEPEMKDGSTWLYADGAVLVPVTAGPFIMGHGGPADPIRQVNLPDFWIYQNEVTNRQYAYCVEVGLCTPPSGLDNDEFLDQLAINDPVVGVDYNQATSYCGFVNARLPTEAEWEKAARGPDARPYPWGDTEPNCDLVNYLPCDGETTQVNIHPLGQSYYLAFDMAGNVFEWVFDRYQEDYYLSAPVENPQGPEKGLMRSIRSSAFNSGGNQIQVYNRFSARPTDHRSNLGFRCVVDDPSYFAPFCEYAAIYGTEGIGGAPADKGIQVSCPDISFTQNPTCNGTSPVTYIHIDKEINYLPSTTFVGLCTQNGPTAWDLTCSKDTYIGVCATCRTTITWPPQCPVNYTYDPNTKKCIGKGTPGACLPGTTAITTSSGQCCNYTPGIAGPTADPSSPGATVTKPGGSPPFPYPNCPAGSSPLHDTTSDIYKCLKTYGSFPYSYCDSVGVVLNSCTSGGGGEETTGGCPPQSCGQNYAWDPSSCSCVCDGC